jgi:unsaturated rhamnogalacturonyl hydrolase
MNTDTTLSLIDALATQTMHYPFKVWGFGEGIALEALWDAEARISEGGYRAFVLSLFERWLQRPLVEADHSAPGILLLTLWEDTGDARFLERARDLAQHLLGLPQTTAKAALHRPQHADYHDFLYVDCMEVDAPFLVKLGLVTGNWAYVDAGVQQIIAYCTLLQDDASGLFYHQFNAATQQVNGAFWGRGNGWALLGLIKTLHLLPTEHPGYAELTRRFVRLADALIARQNDAGGWHTVLDQPASYEESSLMAMFGVGLLLGTRNGLLGARAANASERAWTRMISTIHDGLLEGVSVATPPGDAAHYAQIVTGSEYPWGQGPALWFALTRLP